MAFLKGFALGLLSFILFILLVVFGLAFTVHQTVLNPHFANSIINDLDFSETARELLTQQNNGGEATSPELINAVVSSLDKAEPTIKKSLNIAVDDTYAYLLGKTKTPDLRGTLRDSVLNSQFLDSLLQNIDLSQIVGQALKSDSTGSVSPESQAFQDSMIVTIKKLEPSLKTQLVAASDPIFKYILSDTNSIDLKTTLRTTLLNKAFLTELINDIDMKSLASDTVSGDLNSLPQGITLTSGEVDQIVTAIEPALKQGFIDAADPIADYMVGTRSDFAIHISTNSIMSSTVKPIVKQAYLAQLPAELANATTAQKDAAFELYWTSAQSSIPASFDIDSNIFGTTVQQSISDGLTSMQKSLTSARDSITKAETKIVDKLEQPRKIIHIFQLAYWGLIILMLLIIGLIILIKRSVRGASRTLGINFIIYGAIWFAGTVIARVFLTSAAFLDGAIPAGSPQFVRDLVPSLILKVTQPLFIFTLIVLILGIGLLVLLFVYPKKKPAEPVTVEAVKQ